MALTYNELTNNTTASVLKSLQDTGDMPDTQTILKEAYDALIALNRTFAPLGPLGRKARQAEQHLARALQVEGN